MAFESVDQLRKGQDTRANWALEKVIKGQLLLRFIQQEIRGRGWYDWLPRDRGGHSAPLSCTSPPP